MSIEHVLTDDYLVARLRANLDSAGIAVAASDIEQIVARGYLQDVRDFELLAAALQGDAPPDYLRQPTTPVLSSDGATDSETHLGNAPHQASTRNDRFPTHLPWLDGPTTALLRLSLAEVAALVQRREVSAAELTRASLRAIDAAQPVLNAFQAVLPESAMAAAQQADRDIAAGMYRGALHGVPVAIKDLLAMRGTETTAGSRIFAGRITAYDAAAVERLRQAGAVIVGKTRLSEFAYSPGSNNTHYLPTHNPWHLDLDTGGSSSGSGAAVSASLVYAALGTDTGGSIRIPSALCGVVGLKPTFGRCSLYGCDSLAWSLDHLGPLTRDVHDAALVLQVLAGPDERDMRTAGTRAWPYRSGRLNAGVRGLRVGVLGADGSGGALGTTAAVDGWRAGLHALEAAGATLIPLDIPEVAQLRRINSAILVLEAAAFHLNRLRTRLADFGPFPRYRILHAFAYGPLALVQAEQWRTVLRARMDRLWERVDLLSTPSMPSAAPALGTPAFTTFTAPFNCLGWPAVTVPAALSPAGLPLGLQLVGPHWEEERVLRAAMAVDQAEIARLP